MLIQRPPAAAGKKIIVIVGAGFAGLNAAKALANVRDTYVVLFDQRNHHLFQPLLYQVATAGLNPSDIAVPVRAQFAKARNVEVHLARIENIDLVAKTVTASGGSIAYDYVVLACGAQHSYFAHPEWEQHAPGLKSVEQALEIRRRILMAFEQAENELDAAKRDALLTFVVVGGGPTGVEMAGAIADISRSVLVRDFKNIDPAKAKIILIEAGKRILAAFPDALAERAQADLTTMGVEVRTSTRVDALDGDGFQVGDQRCAAKTIIWAAGVEAVKVDITPPVAADKQGRLVVEPNFAIPGHAGAFAIGDMAAFQLGGGSLPGLAPAAIQAGKYVAGAIVDALAGKTRADFRYHDKGMMATIGKHRAVAAAGRLRMTGSIAWLAWLFVHVLYLVGFKNRVAVLLQWTWNYLFSRRGSRLITERDWTLKR